MRNIIIRKALPEESEKKYRGYIPKELIALLILSIIMILIGIFL